MTNFRQFNVNAKYIGKMGAGLIDAAQLLNGIQNKELSSEMKLPNMYVGIEKTTSLNRAARFCGPALPLAHPGL